MDEVKAALDGYKAGTYGGAKKGMMERVVKPLSEEDIEALATHIDGL
jgi:cytochrome c